MHQLRGRGAYLIGLALLVGCAGGLVWYAVGGRPDPAGGDASIRRDAPVEQAVSGVQARLQGSNGSPERGTVRPGEVAEGEESAWTCEVYGRAIRSPEAAATGRAARMRVSGCSL